MQALESCYKALTKMTWQDSARLLQQPIRGSDAKAAENQRHHRLEPKRKRKVNVARLQR